MNIWKEKIWILFETMLCGAGGCSAFLKGISMRKFWFVIAAAVVLGAFFPGKAEAAPRLQEIKGEKIVIVIDPGHGGENLGTIEGSLEEEKFMTLTTALAMYEELQKYDNVEVYLTRTDDSDVIIKDRAEFAASVNADFLFSIHYNASEYHELYGSEVWVSLHSPYNAYGYQFGYEFLTDMKKKGLFIRGVKTRKGTNGDYYGIIRESAALEIPAVIIEHCHVDEERDAVYCDDEEKLRDFGRADALAAAKYFGLKSTELGVDYSDHQLAEASPLTAAERTLQDGTEPDVCVIELQDVDYEKGILRLSVMAADYDSALLYYSYSIDGGETFSERQSWPGCDALTGNYQDTFTLELLIEEGTAPEVILRAYNVFDLYTESSCYVSPQIFPSRQADVSEETDQKTSGEEQETDRKRKEETVPADASVFQAAEDGDKRMDIVTFVVICLMAAVVMLALVIVSQTIACSRRSRRRRRR